jgi:hypothetical protein
MATVEHGAVIGMASGRAPRFASALDEVLGTLGFTPGSAATLTRWPRQDDEHPELEVSHFVPERGAWACVGTTPAMARAIAVKLAARLELPVQLFTATARYDDRSLACTVEDRLVRANGASAIGAFARELEDSVGGDWRDLCDHKSYFAMTALLDAAIDAWVATPFKRRDVTWLPPATLGDRRLDELALRIRLATRAQLTTMDGRVCVRVTTADGATTTSFLTPTELARLEPAVAGLMTS